MKRPVHAPRPSGSKHVCIFSTCTSLNSRPWSSSDLIPSHMPATVLCPAGVTPAVQGTNENERSDACLSIGTAKDSTSIRTPISLQRLSASFRFKSRRHEQRDSSIGTIPDTAPDSNAIKRSDSTHCSGSAPRLSSPAPNKHPCGNEPAVACLCRSSKDGKNVNVVLTVTRSGAQADQLPATRVLFTSPDISAVDRANVDLAEQNSEEQDAGRCPNGWTDSELRSLLLNDDGTGVSSIRSQLL